MRSQIPEFELVALLRARDNRGYKILYECYKKTLITSVIQKYFEFDTNTWDDIMSNVFMNVFRHIDGFKDEYALFTWLRTITFNECRTLKCSRNQRKKALTLNYENCYDFYEERSINNVLYVNDDFLNEYKFLNPISLDILKKFFVEGYKPIEIGESLEISRSQVDLIKKKALIKIKRYHEKTKRHSTMVG